jgi:hypothetical protein
MPHYYRAESPYFLCHFPCCSSRFSFFPFSHFSFYLLHQHQGQGPRAGGLQRVRDERPVAHSHHLFRSSILFVSEKIRQAGTSSATGFFAKFLLQHRPMVACVFSKNSCLLSWLEGKEPAGNVRFDCAGLLHVIMICRMSALCTSTSSLYNISDGDLEMSLESSVMQGTESGSPMTWITYPT